MMSLTIVFWLVVGVLVCGALQLAHFAWLMNWSDRQTNGLNYYGLSAAARSQFKRRLRRHALLLTPIRWLLSRCGNFKFTSGTFRHRGVPGPKAGSCSEQTFRAAERYQPTQDDVFVVTQMRSGTTWMQHLVFQVLSRGARDLAAEDVCLNAISPWLESQKCLRADHVTGLINGRHVQGNKIGSIQQRLEAFHPFYLARQSPGGLHRQGRIETGNTHAHFERHVGDH